MAQLTTDMASTVEKAEDPFGLIDEGTYLVRLEKDVDVKDGSNAPYWQWTFVIEPGQPFAGRKITHRTSLADNAFFRLRQTFEAFEVPASTNTEELVGKTIRLKMIAKVSNFGQRAGEWVNEIKATLVSDGPTGIDEAAKADRLAKVAADGKAAEAEAKSLF